MAVSIIFLGIAIVLLIIILAKASEILRKLDYVDSLIKMAIKKIDNQAEMSTVAETEQDDVSPPVYVPENSCLGTEYSENNDVIEEREEKEKAVDPPIAYEIDKNEGRSPQDVGSLFAVRSSIKKIKAQSQAGSDEKSKLSRDWEKFIGENLMSKIGIAVLVLGIGFFVKYAIDKNWVNEYGRVAIGYLSGAILVSVAHYLRKNYSTFSSILIGGGFAVFYITTAIGFHYYEIFSQTAAFAIAVIITMLAVFFSLAYDKKELAVLSILGGFISPLMLSTGDGSYKILFSYIIILDLGMLVLAYFKKWNIVTIVSYACTVLLFGIWSVSDFVSEQPHYIPAFAYGSVFYIIFFVMTIINNLVENKKFQAFDISILLSNTFLYFGLGLSALGYAFDKKYNGIFTIALALLNMAFTLFLYKKNKIDKNLIYLLLALVLTFITLAGPIQLDGNYITLFWAAEACVLLWFYRKSGIMITKHISAVIIFLAFVSLVMDWGEYDRGYNASVFAIVFNKVFATSVSMAVALFVKHRLLKDETDKILGIAVDAYRTMLVAALFVVLYLGVMIEISYQSSERLPSVAQMIFPISFHLFFFLSMFWVANVWHKPLLKLFYWLNFSTIGLFILVAIPYTYLVAASSTARSGYLPFSLVQFGLFIAIVASLIVRSGTIIQSQSNRNLLMWCFVFFITVAISTQLDYVLVMISQDMSVLKHSHRIGYPILWSLSSFVVMYVGMKKQNKNLRIISISLFGLVLLKLFLYDVWTMNEAGKIVAFILLGAILLLISFLYQKLKKLLVDDDTAARNNIE